MSSGSSEQKLNGPIGPAFQMPNNPSVVQDPYSSSYNPANPPRQGSAMKAGRANNAQGNSPNFGPGSMLYNKPMTKHFLRG